MCRMSPKPHECSKFEDTGVTTPYDFIGFGYRPHAFIRFGAMGVTKPHAFIKLGATSVTKPFDFMCFGPKPYACITVGLTF